MPSRHPSRVSEVVLVDERDRPLGIEEKLRAHQRGVLHRAFSAVVVDEDGRVLLQQRALGKYHSGGLWTNTCCSHPHPGEETVAAATRRTREEMGIECTFTKAFSMIYRADLGHGLVEHEYDHVLISVTPDVEPVPDPAEVAAYAWRPLAQVIADISRRPEEYTVWFRLLVTPLVIALRGPRPASLPIYRFDIGPGA